MNITKNIKENEQALTAIECAKRSLEEAQKALNKRKEFNHFGRYKDRVYIVAGYDREDYKLNLFTKDGNKLKVHSNKITKATREDFNNQNK